MLITAITVLFGLFGKGAAKDTISRVATYVRIGLYVFAAILVLGLVFRIAYWFVPQPKLNEKQIQELQSSVREERMKVLADEFVKRDEVLKEAAEEGKITDQLIDERKSAITQKVIEADKKIEKAKQLKGDVTPDELEKILEEARQ